jgi:hypothetical protein
MFYVMGKKVKSILRETSNGHFVAELEDGDLGYGLPHHVGRTRKAEDMTALVNAARVLDSDSFETFVETLYMAKLV